MVPNRGTTRGTGPIAKRVKCCDKVHSGRSVFNNSRNGSGKYEEITFLYVWGYEINEWCIICITYILMQRLGEA